MKINNNEVQPKAFCHNCGSNITDNLEYCPNCGTKQIEVKVAENKNSKFKKKKVIIFSIIFLVVVLGIIIFLFSSGKLGSHINNEKTGDWVTFSIGDIDYDIKKGYLERNAEFDEDDEAMLHEVRYDEDDEAMLHEVKYDDYNLYIDAAPKGFTSLEERIKDSGNEFVEWKNDYFKGYKCEDTSDLKVCFEHEGIIYSFEFFDEESEDVEDQLKYFYEITDRLRPTEYDGPNGWFDASFGEVKYDMSYKAIMWEYPDEEEGLFSKSFSNETNDYYILFEYYNNHNNYTSLNKLLDFYKEEKTYDDGSYYTAADVISWENKYFKGYELTYKYEVIVDGMEYVHDCKTIIFEYEGIYYAVSLEIYDQEKHEVVTKSFNYIIDRLRPV